MTPDGWLPISEHDLREIAAFKEYLVDKAVMERDDFYRKWQKYMGLTDDEMKRILQGEKL